LAREEGVALYRAPTHFLASHSKKEVILIVGMDSFKKAAVFRHLDKGPSGTQPEAADPADGYIVKSRREHSVA
jgi:hypothetical protein